MYQVKQIFENVYAFEEGVRVRSFLVIGEERAMMLDSGNGLINFDLELPKLTTLPVLLVNTHGDVDHIGKNDQFEVRYIHPDDLQKLKSKRPYENERYMFVRDGEAFDLGGTVLKVITCPGHTPGSIVLYDAEHKLLFAGDAITSNDTFMFSPSINRLQIVASLKKLIDMNLDVKAVLACHDKCPIFNYEQLVRDTCSALEGYLDGKPETDIFHLKRGMLDKYLKRYVFGCASILTEEVKKTT